MKIHVSEIPEEGLELSEQIDQHQLFTDTELIVFTGPIDAKADVKKFKDELFVNVTIAVPVEYTCARCLGKKEGAINKSFEIVQDVKPNEVVDINGNIREETMLDFPMKVLCRDDCKGLCPNCGQNLNIMQCECHENVI
jgi:uncharacterized protein